MNEPAFAEITRRVEAFIERGGAVTRPGAMEGEFDALALELFGLQFQFVPVYRAFCQTRGVLPQAVKRWHVIPALPIAAFKQADVTSLEPAKRNRVFYSSGTTAQERSRHYHDAGSLALYNTSLLGGFTTMVCSRRNFPVQLVLLTPPPEQAPHSSLAHMFATLGERVGNGTPATFGAVDSEGAWHVRTAALREALAKFIAAGTPIALLGTAFNFMHVLDEMAGWKDSVRLPRNSVVLETGGYKGRSRALPRSELHGLLGEVFGATTVSEYGMCELASQAYALDDGVLQFPPWARARVISPETGGSLPAGETGLLQVLDLANARSVLAVQTEDLARASGTGFELLGRVADAEARGCSLLSV